MKGQIEIEVNGEMLEAPFRVHQTSNDQGLMISTAHGGVHMASKDTIRMWIDGNLVFNNATE